MILKGYIIGVLYACVCMAIAGLLYKVGIPKKYTRKVVHILVGFEWFILYHYFGAGIHFLIVCIAFLLLLSVAYRSRLLEMISSDEENAPGTIYYALAMTVVAFVGCFLPEIMLPFGIAVLCTSVGDGLAGVVGQVFKRGNPRIYNEKTLVGTLVNFVMSTVCAYLMSHFYSMELSIWYCLAIGLVSAELETVTGYGLDNIFITWSVTAFAYFLCNFDNASGYILPIIISPVIFAFARKKNALTTGGIIAAIIVDVLISLAFGNLGFVLLSVFFIGAVIIDTIKKRTKKQGRESVEVKGSKRDSVQVLVNSAAACVAAIAFMITGKSVFIVTCAACFAEAFADTAASGIGAFSKHTYDIFKFRKCESGLSGGVSLLGTAASVVAGLIIAFIPFFFNAYGYSARDAFIVALAAFLGTFVDSLLGSLAQVKYKCDKCGAITERHTHCNSKTQRYSGIEAVDNDIVNLISSSTAAIIATVLVLWI